MLLKLFICVVGAIPYINSMFEYINVLMDVFGI